MADDNRGNTDNCTPNYKMLNISGLMGMDMFILSVIFIECIYWGPSDTVSHNCR